MRKKLLIASVALSGLVSAQCTSRYDYDDGLVKDSIKCNYKCGYNEDKNGNTIHLSQCGLLVKMERTQEYEYIHPDYVKLYNRVKTEQCDISKCLLVIREEEKDTVCMEHTSQINYMTIIPELPHYYNED